MDKRLQSGRNLNLDVLRGIAIFLVIGRHIWFEFPDGLFGKIAFRWQFIGWVGVDLFFVLSGFLITGLLFNELQRHGKLKIGHFLIRRGFKIYPPYYVFMGYCIFFPVLKEALKGGDSLSLLRENLALTWPCLLFIQNYVGEIPWGHTRISWGPTWSLGVEEHFYIFLPFLLFFLARKNRLSFAPLVFFVLLGVCLLLRCLAVARWSEDTNYIYMASHHRFDALFCGVAIRFTAQYMPDVFARLGSRPWLCLALGGLAWLPICFWEQMTDMTHTLGLTLTLIGAGLFLIGAFHLTGRHFGALAPVIKQGAKAIGWVGFHSYSIYLWHVQVLWWVYVYFVQRLEGELGNGLVEWLVFNLIAVSGIVVVGVIMTKVVEKPSLALRERFWPSRASALKSA